MTRLCRVCLCGDRNTYAISNTVLQEMWEKLTSSMYNINDGKPITVCFICRAQLRKAHQLMRRAVKAEELLTSFISNGFEQTQEALSAMASETDLDYSYVTKQLYQGECKEFEKDIVVEIKKEKESETEEDNAEEIEIDIKEEKYDSFEEDKLDLDDTKSGALSAHNEHIKREVRIILEKIDPAQITQRKVSELSQNAKRRKLEDITAVREPSPDVKFEMCNQNQNAVIPSTSLEGNTSNVPKRKRPREEKSCHMCSYKCFNKTLLMRHIYTHTGEKPFNCDMCDYKCSRKSNLTGHVMRKHTKKNIFCHTSDNEIKSQLNSHLQGEQPYKCDRCDYRCSEETALQSHKIKTHIKEKKFSCHLCDYKCYSDSGLNRHFRKHAVKTRIKPEKQYLCDFCGYGCSTESLLVIHRRTHTGEKPFKCDYCDYRSNVKRGVELHIKSKHTLEKNYSCHICEYKCVTRSSLNVHVRLHTGAKPYQCDYCDYRCSLKRGVEIHIKRRHTFEKKYSCDMCGYKFVTTSGLKMHLLTHTTKFNSDFQCDLCDYKTSRKDSLIRHLKHHTKDGPKLFYCPSCPYKTDYEYCLNQHLLIHTGEKQYACELCDYKSSRSGGLKRHIRFKHTKEKAFSCSVCQYKCAEKGYLKKHMVMHTGETPYACKICDFKCSFASSYYYHMKSKHRQ